jgi:hypothetical protein
VLSKIIYLFLLEMSDDKQSKIEALRADLTAFPDMLARFNEIHPPLPKGPTTIEEALLGVAHDAYDAATNIDEYLQFIKERKWRKQFAVPCSLEALILH